MNNGECRGREDKFSEQGSFFTVLSPVGHVSDEVTVIFHEWCVLVVWPYIAQLGDVQAAIAPVPCPDSPSGTYTLSALNATIPEPPCRQGSNELSYTIRNSTSTYETKGQGSG